MTNHRYKGSTPAKVRQSFRVTRKPVRQHSVESFSETADYADGTDQSEENGFDIPRSRCAATNPEVNL